MKNGLIYRVMCAEPPRNPNQTKEPNAIGVINAGAVTNGKF